MILPVTSALDGVGKQNEAYDIRITPVANGSIATVLTNITVNDPDGNVIVFFQSMQKNLDSQDFNYTLGPSNTSKLGQYDCTAYAFSNIAENQAFSCSFIVNPSGKDYIPEISGPLLFGAIISLISISFFLFFLALKIDLFPMKVFLIILAGMIAIMNLGFVTGSFQEFFSIDSTLSGAFGTLYVIFMILMTGASIFLFLWILVVGFRLYKIKRGFFVEDEF